MKTTITTALLALTFVAVSIASQAQAGVEWRFPYKGAPYAVPHTHGQTASDQR